MCWRRNDRCSPSLTRTLAERRGGCTTIPLSSLLSVSSLSPLLSLSPLHSLPSKEPHCTVTHHSDSFLARPDSCHHPAFRPLLLTHLVQRQCHCSGERHAEGFGQTIIKAARNDTSLRTNLGRGRLCLRQMLMQVRCGHSCSRPMGSTSCYTLHSTFIPSPFLPSTSFPPFHFIPFNLIPLHYTSFPPFHFIPFTSFPSIPLPFHSHSTLIPLSFHSHSASFPPPLCSVPPQFTLILC